ncbi:MAG: CBS domain-containing protein, partial [Marinomonas gallaica]
SVMHEQVLSVSPSMQVMQVAKLMMEDKPKIFPVVEDGRLIGVITRRIVTQTLLKAQKTCIPV